MTVQTSLIILLVSLSAVLAILLLRRIRAERKRSAVLSGMSLADFSDFLRANSDEGSIQAVAGKVSDLLKSVFGCESIVFLRRRRQHFDLSYFHGISNFDRREFRTRILPETAKALHGRIYPQAIEELRSVLAPRLYRRLVGWHLDLCFPIFWRNNLFGVYFIRSNRESESPDFRMFIATLAQSLSAAYHIKWQERRYDRLAEQVQALTESRSRLAPNAEPGKTGVVIDPDSGWIFELIQHRDSETLVGRIIERVREDLDLDRVLFVYESKGNEAPLRLLKDGVTTPIQPPEPEAFRHLVETLGGEQVRPLATLEGGDSLSSEYGRQLQKAGLEFCVTFPLSATRRGLLAWQNPNPPDEVIARLRRHGENSLQLMNNAEEFERVRELSYTDNLTGLANRRYFTKRLDEEIDRADRYKRSLALILFDMDELKGINDAYGHQAGDEVIRQLGGILAKSIRSIDVIARFGGDEFCMIMPEADGATCKRFMDRLQTKVATSKFPLHQLELEVTCSISQGGAVYPEQAKSSEQLIYAADMALLRAKQAGRNSNILYT